MSIRATLIDSNIDRGSKERRGSVWFFATGGVSGGAEWWRRAVFSDLLVLVPEMRFQRFSYRTRFVLTSNWFLPLSQLIVSDATN